MTVQEPIEWKMIVQRIIYGKVELDSGNVYLYLVLGESPYCMYFVNIIFHSTEWHKPKLLTITCVLIWHHLFRWYTLILLADIAMLFMKTHNIPSSCILYPNLNLFGPYLTIQNQCQNLVFPRQFSSGGAVHSTTTITISHLYRYFSGAVALLVYGLLFLVWPGEMQKLLFSFIRIVDLCFRNERLNTTCFAD